MQDIPGVPVTTEQSPEDDDYYGDFAEDPEELEIIEQLLREAAEKRNLRQDTPLAVTDIEDYEAPRGVRLSKVLGVETTRHWDIQSRATAPLPTSTLLHQSGELSVVSRALRLTDWLTSG